MEGGGEGQGGGGGGGRGLEDTLKKWQRKELINMIWQVLTQTIFLNSDHATRGERIRYSSSAVKQVCTQHTTVKTHAS